MKTLNQRGISLVELLAYIALFSIVVIMLWGIFFSGTSYSSKAITKNQLQQEANVILSELTTIHQTKSSYSIVREDLPDGGAARSECSFKVTFSDGTAEKQFTNSNMCVELNIPSSASPINSLTTDISITITVSELANENNKIEISSLLHRLKGG